MRLLLADPPVHATVPLGGPLDVAALAELYAVPAGADSWLRVNMVTTVDGAAFGADGRSGTINTDADHVVFELLRALSDVVLVGAGTLRIEGYGALGLDPEMAALRARQGRSPDVPLAVVSRAGQLPPSLAQAPPGRVIAVTHAAAPGLSALRATLGADQVVVAGDGAVDLGAALRALAERGLRHVLSEGGPHLLGSFLAAGVVDELDLTWSPVAVAGTAGRIVAGVPVERALAPRALVEHDGTLMGRWLRASP